MRDGEGARFLFRMAKAARKRHAGLTVITQDAADVLGTDLGQAVVVQRRHPDPARQAPQAIDAVADAFGLTAGERRLLLVRPPRRGAADLPAPTAAASRPSPPTPSTCCARRRPAELAALDDEEADDL